MTDESLLGARASGKVRKGYRSGDATRDLIVRTAERLFAASGIDGVSIRDITRAAGVELSMINYHFGNKDGLFEAVISPRIREIAQDRQDRLENLPPGFTVTDVVDAFYLPFHDRMASADMAWKHYAEIVVQIAYADRYSHFRHKYFDEIAERFVDAFATIYPKVDRKILYWSYSFMAGSLAHVLSGSDRLYRLTDGACDTRDLGTAFAEARRFTVHGISGRIEDLQGSADI